MQKQQPNSIEAVYDLYPSLQRLKGIEAIDGQIKRFEEVWRMLVEDMTLFLEDIREMKQKKILLLGTRAHKNYGIGKNLPDYPKDQYYIPSFCFTYRKKNLYDWDKIYALLQQMNASADEIMIHLQIFLGMRDFFHRAGLLVFRLRQLYDLKVEAGNALSVSGLDTKMLPDRMKYNLDEEDFPGY